MIFLYQVRRDIIKNVKFKNINDLYKINKIKEGKIVINNKDKIKNVYLYRVQPIQIISLSQELQEKILTTYKEFLKEINFDFQILVINKKIDINNFLTIYYDKELIKNSYFYNSYIEAVKKELEFKDFYISEYYIVVSYNGNIEHIDRILDKIAKTGCLVDRVKEKSVLEKILYNSFNKYY